jgi:hypothetical protein
MVARRKLPGQHANRLLGLLPPETTNGFARIFTVFRWSTNNLSTAPTGASSLSISSRLALAPW